MNETVKNALLIERDSARMAVEERERSNEQFRRRLQGGELQLTLDQQRLADIELHLKDNGVDLAAVDAEAARKPSAMQAYAGTHATGSAYADYVNGLSNVNSNLGRSLSSFNGDPTTGLVKALDEA